MFYWELFFVFLKIGWLTIGGGYVMIPLFLEEIVKKRKWLKEEEFLETLTLAQLFPGPIAFNFAVAVGYRLKKYKGALISALGVIIPSFVSILIIAMFFIKWHKSKIIQGLLYGMRPAIAGLMAYSVYELLKKMNFTLLKIFIIISLSFILIFFKINPIYIIITSFVFSIIWVYWKH
ncbi:MAG: chromate transporter [Dictyoglomaceae bacterium]